MRAGVDLFASRLLIINHHGLRFQLVSMVGPTEVQAVGLSFGQKAGNGACSYNPDARGL